MVSDVLLFLVTSAIAVLVANRLYAMIRHEAININGVRYSKSDAPVIYWAITAGLIVLGGMTILIAAAGLGRVDKFERPFAPICGHARVCYLRGTIVMEESTG